MAKRVFYATTKVAKAVNLEVPEFDWSGFKVINTSVKRDNGGDHLDKIVNPTQADLDDDTVKVFVMLDVEDVDSLIIKDMAVLNAGIDSDRTGSFLNVIDITDGKLIPKKGMEVRCTGKTLEFRVA